MFPHASAADTSYARCPLPPHHLFNPVSISTSNDLLFFFCLSICQSAQSLRAALRSIILSWLLQFIDMASDSKVSESETRNADGSVMEKRVETVHYQSTPARSGPTERRRDVEVVHQYQPSEADSGSGAGSMVADAAASMASSIRSAKDAISGKVNESSK
ncbi:hypothetical protein AAC387_Pa03g3707 [Persea americana]